MLSIGTPLLWSLFAAFVLVALAIDFLALNRQGAHTVTMREAGVWSLVWVAVSFLFVAWLWWYLGGASNVFAILGLRAMYFLLAGMHERFHLLSYGLAVVLVFIGTKMLLIDVYKIPIAWSLGFTVTVLALTMLLSLRIPARPGEAGSAYPFGAKKRDGRAEKESR